MILPAPEQYLMTQAWQVTHVPSSVNPGIRIWRQKVFLTDQLASSITVAMSDPHNSDREKPDGPARQLQQVNRLGNRSMRAVCHATLCSSTAKDMINIDS
jgi:hypothetical protein